MLSFWDSISSLRQIEFIVIGVVMIVPLVCGSILFSVRHRIKTLQTQTSQSLGFSYQETVRKLEAQKHRLATGLESSGHEVAALRRINAPREITEQQENILVEKLRGVRAAPVTVSAYAFEDESAAYAAQIAGALRKAGWDVTLAKSSMNDFKGISLGTVNLMRRPINGLHELAEAFTAAHLELHQREIAPDSIAGSLQDGSLLVVVGRK